MAGACCASPATGVAAINPAAPAKKLRRVSMARNLLFDVTLEHSLRRPYRNRQAQGRRRGAHRCRSSRKSPKGLMSAPGFPTDAIPTKYRRFTDADFRPLFNAAFGVTIPPPAGIVSRK